jgi:hypothetical protein
VARPPFVAPLRLRPGPSVSTRLLALLTPLPRTGAGEGATPRASSPPLLVASPTPAPRSARGAGATAVGVPSRLAAPRLALLPRLLGQPLLLRLKLALVLSELELGPLPQELGVFVLGRLVAARLRVVGVRVVGGVGRVRDVQRGFRFLQLLPAANI